MNKKIIIDAKCDIYQGPNLNGLNIESGKSIEQIIKALDDILSTLTVDVQNCCSSVTTTTTIRP
jgi:predicted oxidoreductase